MKLTDIDLNDREEIAAAHALLGSILGASAQTMTITNSVGDVSQTVTGTQSQLQATGHLEPSAAQVFGGHPLPGAGTLAPSTAGVALPGTVPGVLPGSLLPGASLAAQTSAALPGSEALVQQGAAGLMPSANGVELDTDGIPWDERIHASTKSKNADGRWKKKKGMNDESKVNAIIAELKARVQGQQLGALVQQQTQPGVVGGVSAMALPGAGATFLPGAQDVTHMALPGAPVPMAQTADPTTFETLMPRVSAATASGAMPPNAVQLACQAVGLAGIVALQQQPQFVPAVWATLRASYPGLQ